jgi:type II secretory pathway component PulK
MKNRHRQGSALLSVMVVLALAAVLVVAMVRGQAADTRTAAQFTQTLKAWHLALAAEKEVLAVLAASDNPVSLLRKTQQSLLVSEQDSAQVAWVLEDAQARFNVNSLSQPRKGPETFWREVAAQAGLPPERADALLLAMQAQARRVGEQQQARVQLESAPQPEGIGGCSGYPFLLEASQLLELGATPEEFRVLEPRVVALPDSCVYVDQRMNAEITQALESGAPLSPQQERSLRPDAEVVSDSRYLLLEIKAASGSETRTLKSLLLRQNDPGVMQKPQVISRQWR